MSLKFLHLFIVAISTVASCAYGMWSFLHFFRGDGTSWLLFALPLLGLGLALTMHGVIFFKHTEDEPWH